MKVISLQISKRENYDRDYPNEIVGVVQISGENGKIEIKLTPKTVSEIFRICKNDVQKVADYNASQASIAVQNAADEIDLQISNKELKQIN